MKKYIARRLFLFIPTLLGVSIAIFALLRIIPGDIATAILAGPGGEADYTEEDVQQIRRELGLDNPIYVQYADWMWDLVRGDLGNSVALQRPIWDEIKRQFPVSLQLGILTVIVIWIIAIPIGIIAAIKQDSWVDYVLRGIAILGLAMPSFFVGLLLSRLLPRLIRLAPKDVLSVAYGTTLPGTVNHRKFAENIFPSFIHGGLDGPRQRRCLVDRPSPASSS